MPLVNSEVARRFVEQVLKWSRSRQLRSAECFTVDSTSIESWASLKSLKKKGARSPKDGGAGTGMVDFKGERRTNSTHESTTDAEVKVMRRGWGAAAKQSIARHALMENRNWLCADLQTTDARLAEPKAAERMLTQQRRRRIRPISVGADKGDCTRTFVTHLRQHEIQPHIAPITNQRTPGFDPRTTPHESYRISQRKRKRAEEIFGWLKTVAGFRKCHSIGIERTQLYAYFAASAYNLLRMSRLTPADT